MKRRFDTRSQQQFISIGLIAAGNPTLKATEKLTNQPNRGETLKFPHTTTREVAVDDRFDSILNSSSSQRTSDVLRALGQIRKVDRPQLDPSSSDLLISSPWNCQYLRRRPTLSPPKPVEVQLEESRVDDADDNGVVEETPAKRFRPEATVEANNQHSAFKPVTSDVSFVPVGIPLKRVADDSVRFEPAAKKHRDEGNWKFSALRAEEDLDEPTAPPEETWQQTTKSQSVLITKEMITAAWNNMVREEGELAKKQPPLKRKQLKLTVKTILPSTKISLDNCETLANVVEPEKIMEVLPKLSTLPTVILPTESVAHLQAVTTAPVANVVRPFNAQLCTSVATLLPTPTFCVGQTTTTSTQPSATWNFAFGTTSTVPTAAVNPPISSFGVDKKSTDTTAAVISPNVGVRMSSSAPDLSALGQSATTTSATLAPLMFGTTTTASLQQPTLNFGSSANLQPFSFGAAQPQPGGFSFAPAVVPSAMISPTLSSTPQLAFGNTSTPVSAAMATPTGFNPPGLTGGTASFAPGIISTPTLNSSFGSAPNLFSLAPANTGGTNLRKTIAGRRRRK